MLLTLTRMKKYLILCLLLCVFIVPIIIYRTTVSRDYSDGYATRGYNKRSVLPVLCESLLLHLNTTVPILLIDTQLLEQIESQQCTVTDGKPIRIGVDVKFLTEKNLLEDSRFEVWFYTNESNKDYLDFRTEPRKIIPKKFTTRWVDKVELPTNIPVFLEFWKRAKFVDCLNLYVPRSGGEVRMKKPSLASAALANLRDELIDHGVFPFLNGGTLLGWYRECSVIPHTADMDFAVFADNYNPEFLETVKNNKSAFWLSRQLGMVNDSYELTLAPRTGYRVFIDVFLMYQGVENGTDISYVGGVDPAGTKYKFTYPRYDPWCSADLHGHIFWITCTPNEKVVKEYGQLWYQDVPTSKYAWNAAGRTNGRWTEEQMKVVYHDYGRVGDEAD